MTDRMGGNQFVLPGCLNFFQNSDGKCEHNIKTAKPLLLKWYDRIKQGENADKFATKTKFFPKVYSDDTEVAAADD